jgi:DUF1009 family protein
VTTARLGIVAGEGDLPFELFEAARRQGREALILAIEGQADPKRLAGLPHEWFELKGVGDFLDISRRHGVTEMVLGGDLQPWHMRAVPPDAWLRDRLPDIQGRLRWGENEVVAFLIAEFEKEGLRVIGPKSIAGHLFPDEGQLGRHAPVGGEWDDIAIGIEAAKTIGRLDIGQAAVVQDRAVLAVEGAEGTDALIRRSRSLRKGNHAMVLVKVTKPQQELRADPPVIGPLTVSAAAQSGFAGIAIEAGGTIVVDRESTVRLADEEGVYLVAVRVPQ